MSGNIALRRYRTEHGLTQEALGARLGVTSITVSRWETGTRKVGASQVADVSRVTGIPAVELRPDLAEIFRGRQ